VTNRPVGRPGRPGDSLPRFLSSDSSDSSDPQGRSAMSELARWCFRHRFTVVTSWAVTLVAIAVPYLMLGASYNNAFNLPGMESTRAQGLLQANTLAQADDSDQIVIHTRHGSVQDPAVQHRVPRC
jgi:uncharacterized membrane protein YdfJ with MMPL/SSD domain